MMKKLTQELYKIIFFLMTMQFNHPSKMSCHAIVVVVLKISQ